MTVVEGLAIVRLPGQVFHTRPVFPLSISADPDVRSASPLWLRVRYTATLDEEGEHLAVQTSVMGLCIDAQTMRGPFRIEYDRDMVGKQAAHLQVDAQSDSLGCAYAQVGRRLKPLPKLHIPLGGRRFRPSLEDFIEFLRQEGLISHLHPGWRDALETSRGDWLHRQTRAAVRRAPQAGVEQLRHMGYDVTGPPG